MLEALEGASSTGERDKADLQKHMETIDQFVKFSIKQQQTETQRERQSDGAAGSEADAAPDTGRAKLKPRLRRSSPPTGPSGALQRSLKGPCRAQGR